MMYDLGNKRFHCFSAVYFKENLSKKLILPSEISEHQDQCKTTECI
jgi:hypothetical protein